MDDHCQNFRTLLDGWITLSSLTFIFRHHWVTVDCFYLFISYLYYILKVNVLFFFINSGLFYKWACGFKRENSSRKWKWHLATLKPSFRSLPTIPVSLPTFHDAVTAMLEIVLRVDLKMLHSVACSLLYGSQHCRVNCRVIVAFQIS